MAMTIGDRTLFRIAAVARFHKSFLHLDRLAGRIIPAPRSPFMLLWPRSVVGVVTVLAAGALPAAAFFFWEMRLEFRGRDPGRLFPVTFSLLPIKE